MNAKKTEHDVVHFISEIEIMYLIILEINLSTYVTEIPK